MVPPMKKALCQSDNHMKNHGFINLLPEDRQVRKMTDKPRGRGVDGIYQNSNPPPPYVITETKYRTQAGKYIDDDGLAKDQMLSATTGSTVGGIEFPASKQMDDTWIQPRVINELGLEEAENVLDSNYERWLIIVDDSGGIINITNLNEAASSINNRVGAYSRIE
jgi:hypothetical protein